MALFGVARSGGAGRRGTARLRAVAATLAAMLAASVLAVVAGGPAQAANTSYEVLIDHDSDPTTDMVREFAGRDRYDTAVRLANNFAESKGGLGTVPVVFIASGESLVDSISAAGLAGYYNAPILLTRSNSLPGAVAEFLDDHGTGVVFVLGGSAAISDAVTDELAALDHGPEVVRVAGADRYATAAAAAARIDAASSWCGSLAKGAVLINGASDALGFGVAVQALAYRLQLPVLMTASDELPQATADFIADNKIEHVQVIGGTGTVSAGVEATLERLGVDTVARTDGDSAAEVSVALSMTAAGCTAAAPVSATMVALVRGNADGVASAPVLASSLGRGDMVAPLVVGDTLPAVVRDYLAATPQYQNATTKLDLGIAAIGGTAAVSEATMAAALAAAASSGALTAAIGASTGVNDPIPDGTRSFSLYFSDAVAYSVDANTGIDADLLDKVKDIVEVNGVPTVVATVDSPDGGCGLHNRVDITLASALRAGDRVSVVPGKLTFGTGGDKRTLGAIAPKSVAQPAPPDTTRPTIEVISVENPHDGALKDRITIKVSDAGGFPPEFTDPSNSENSVAGIVRAAVEAGAIVYTRADGNRQGMDVLGFSTPTAFDSYVEILMNGGHQVMEGERLSIPAGLITDAAGNVNRAVTGKVLAAEPSPRIISVLRSPLAHGPHTHWHVPDWVGGGGNTSPNAIRIAAKASGDAAGAAGNDWAFIFDTPTTHDPDQAVDIDVAGDVKRKQFQVRFVNGIPTVGELFAAMRADRDFDSRFHVFSCASPAMKLTPSSTANRRGVAARFINTDGSAAVLLDVQGNPVTDADDNDVIRGIGRTKFAFEVRFSSHIKRQVRDALYEDLFAAAVARNTQAGVTPPTIRSWLADHAITLSPGLALGTPDEFGLPTIALLERPIKVTRHEATTSNIAFVPMAGDPVITAAGTVAQEEEIGGTRTGTVLRTDGVAVGYAADDTDTANVNEELSGASRVRIAVSNRVPAP